MTILEISDWFSNAILGRQDIGLSYVLLHQTQDNAQQDFYIFFQNKTLYS